MEIHAAVVCFFRTDGHTYQTSEALRRDVNTPKTETLRSYRTHTGVLYCLLLSFEV